MVIDPTVYSSEKTWRHAGVMREGNHVVIKSRVSHTHELIHFENPCNRANSMVCYSVGCQNNCRHYLWRNS